MTAAGQATGISVSGGVPADTHTVVGADAPSRVLTGRVPDLTAAQLVGIVGAVVAVAVSFGVNISKEQQEAVLALAAAVGAILFAADAHVRRGRAQAEAVRHVAAQHAATVRHVVDKHLELSQAAIEKGQTPPPLVYPLPPSVPGR